MDISELKDISKLIDQIEKDENFLILGSQGSGKTYWGIQYALHNNENEKCIFFTSTSKNQILKKIQLLNYIPHKNFEENFIIYQAPSISLNNGNKIEDNHLVKILMGILSPIEKLKPKKIVFDEITPYLGFSDLDYLEKTIKKIISFLKYFNVKGMFVISEPASPRAKVIADMLKYQFAGYTNLK